jgi:hypothetical protein
MKIPATWLISLDFGDGMKLKKSSKCKALTDKVRDYE